jgi:hypothetical protein
VLQLEQQKSESQISLEQNVLEEEMMDALRL